MSAPLAVSARVCATLLPMPRYEMALTVVIPMQYEMWLDPASFVDPSPLSRMPGVNLDLATEENLAAFDAASARGLGELRRIFQACNREWRGPTPDEDRRIAELNRDLEVARATFERTLFMAPRQ